MTMSELYTQLSLTKLAKHNPTLIGIVRMTNFGVEFYEHPTHGDNIGLIAVSNGIAWQTDYYDLPHADELTDIVWV